MDQIRDFLSKISFFQGLELEELDDIASIAGRKDLHKGEILFMEGDEGNGFYIVNSGRVKIFKESPDGKEVIIHICGPLDQFGQVAVYAGRTFPASAQAMADSTLLFFPRKEFRELIKNKPDLALSMLSSLSMRIRHVTSQLESIALKEVPGRLAAYLLYLQEQQDNKRELELDISRGELASFLGTIPETLSRIMARLEEERLVRVQKRTLEILDMERLEELASRGKI
ncbi:MAG: Crp/Fnr family transcriptional regulator [Synergistales bacterium]|nr:Crp/Fnr family transcriptional regulator [Synergistales bacterium]